MLTIYAYLVSKKYCLYNKQEKKRKNLHHNTKLFNLFFSSNIDAVCKPYENACVDYTVFEIKCQS